MNYEKLIIYFSPPHTKTSSIDISYLNTIRQSKVLLRMHAACNLMLCWQYMHHALYLNLTLTKAFLSPLYRLLTN